MKFKELKDPFLVYKKDYVRISTIAAFDSIFDCHLIPHFGEFIEITQKDIDNYLYTKSLTGLSKGSLETHVTVLKAILTWSNRTGVFKIKNFRANYPAEMAEKTEIKPLSVEESKILVRHCEENFTFSNLMICTVLFTGLRAGEACGLQWKDIDIDRGTLSVSKTVGRVSMANATHRPADFANNGKVIVGTPKTPNSIRELPLSKQLINFYRPLKKIVNPEFYIMTNNLTPSEPATLRKHLAIVLSLLNLPEIRLHDLRHTFATRCIALGIDIKTVSVLLGHATVVITMQTYMHTDEDAKNDAMAKLSKKMLW